MKMKKFQVQSLVPVLLVCLSLSGCSSKNSQASDTQKAIKDHAEELKKQHKREMENR
jgi:hypothetical protein